MEEKDKNEELKQQEMNEDSPVARTTYSTGTGMGPNDCMSQDFFNSLNDRGAISSIVYVCGWGWTIPGASASGSGSASRPGCSCGCCSYDLCSCINSGSGSGCGCGSGSGSSGSSGSGSDNSHNCACRCYYCGAYGCGAGSGCGCGCGCGSGYGSGESKSPIELMNSSKFVGFRVGVQCLALCKEILDKYGISSYGSPAAVFRLVDEGSGSLSNWGDSQNYQNAVNCIDKHLNANKPIIVGVDHTLGKGINEGTTDHFVVITGRGMEGGKLYYTFMDPATSHSYKGCTTENRLYSDPVSGRLSGTTKAKDKDNFYTVAQIRPNDGGTYATTKY